MLLYRNKLHSAATTGNGIAFNLDGEVADVKFLIKGTGTISAGAVQIEEAMTTDDADTWQPIGSAITPISGATQAINFSGPFLALRCRISTNLTGGGTVTVEVIAGE